MGARGPIPHEGSRRSQGQNPPKADGIPDVPDGLAEPGKSLWLEIVDYLDANKLIGSVDSAAVHECCRLYNLLNKAHEAAALDPIDKNVRCAVTGYYAAWSAAATKLGITPADRCRLQRNNQADDSDEDRELLD